MTLWGWVKLCWKMVGCMFKEYNQQKFSHINKKKSRKKIICMHVKACLEIFCNFFNKLFSRHLPDS